MLEGSDKKLDFAYTSKEKAPAEYGGVTFYLDHKDDGFLKQKRQVLTEKQKEAATQTRRILEKALEKQPIPSIELLAAYTDQLSQ